MAAEPTRAIAYIRRNTPTDADTANRSNIEVQRIAAYCALNRITLIGMQIEDPGTRLGLDDRPVLRACLAALSTGQADALIVPTLRTLSRAIAELAPWLSRHFTESSPYRLIAVQEQIDTRQPTGCLALGVLSALSLCERGASHA